MALHRGHGAGMFADSNLLLHACTLHSIHRNILTQTVTQDASILALPNNIIHHNLSSHTRDGVAAAKTGLTTYLITYLITTTANNCTTSNTPTSKCATKSKAAKTAFRTPMKTKTMTSENPML
jgi:hypothetical protein